MNKTKLVFSTILIGIGILVILHYALFGLLPLAVPYFIPNGEAGISWLLFLSCIISYATIVMINLTLLGVVGYILYHWKDKEQK